MAGGRQRGNSDPIDVRALARAALREPDLPQASLDGLEHDVRLLLDHRDDLVLERTGAQKTLEYGTCTRSSPAGILHHDISIDGAYSLALSSHWLAGRVQSLDCRRAHGSHP